MVYSGHGKDGRGCCRNGGRGRFGRGKKGGIGWWVAAATWFAAFVGVVAGLGGLEEAKNMLVRGDLLGAERASVEHREWFGSLDGEWAHVYGASLYGRGRYEEAYDWLKQAAEQERGRVVRWLNLGDVCVALGRTEEALEAYEEGMRVVGGNVDGGAAASKVWRARSSGCVWRGWDELIVKAVRGAREAVAKQLGMAASPADLLVVPKDLVVDLTKIHAKISGRAGVNGVARRKVAIGSDGELQVVFLSSDFGIHPVAQLIRALVEHLQRTNGVNVTCVALAGKASWWRAEIQSVAGGFVDLAGSGFGEIAKELERIEADVVVDLNGHTLGGGLAALSYFPAAVQVSFLGYAGTSGVDAVSHIIADRVAVAPDINRVEFSEKLALTKNSFFSNDYAVAQAHVPRLPRPAFPAPIAFSKVVAVFSSWSKMSPDAATVWARVLRQTPGAILWIIRHPGWREAEPRFRKEMEARGVPSSRIISTAQAPWVDHIRRKMAADIVLDTFVKNGHTSTADALWAGVPVVTLPGDRMQNRVALSLLQATTTTLSPTTPITKATSKRDYEVLAARLLHFPTTITPSKHTMNPLRQNNTASPRKSLPLFDQPQNSKNFLRLLQALIETKIDPTSRPVHVILN